MTVLAIKILIGAMIGKDFSWCGHAYDCCVMSFAACVPTLVISMAFTRGDLGTWAAFSAVTFICLLATGRTYQIVSGSQSMPIGTVALVGLSLLLGFGNFGLYTLLAIEKVQQAGLAQ